VARGPDEPEREDDKAALRFGRDVIMFRDNLMKMHDSASGVGASMNHAGGLGSLRIGSPL